MGNRTPCRIGFIRGRDEDAGQPYLMGILVRPGAENDEDWRCECGDLNRHHEAFCYRCGAGQPEPTPTVTGMVVWPDGRFMTPQPAATPELAMELAEAVGWQA